jgi:proteic killer suppression protein
VIKSFADAATETIWRGGQAPELPPSIHRTALRKLRILNRVVELRDLRVPPNNKLHPLAADRAGQHAIWINDQYRLCFRWAGHDAHDVEITDYH